ncbi:hypothetical protein D3C79_602040 [compost metagenome]
MFRLQLAQARQRVLPVEQRQLAVDLWISLMKQVRGTKEVLAGNGKELCRVFRSVGVDGGFGVGVGVQLLVEVVVGLLHGCCPLINWHAAVQRWQAVGIAIEHVELVRQLMDDQVVSLPATTGLHAVPGQDDRPLLPGLAAVFAVPHMLHATGIAVALGALEVVGVQDDFVEALVPVQLTQVKQG